ncbi:MAG: RAMP superfamily CRISPR-associated protein [Candidatus Brachytrichaceae bacterium NZ_4S206]|jgi:CRISPR/Cas system CSM-associated protein Csm3 (group 7 of RAMP superfamily)
MNEIAIEKSFWHNARARRILERVVVEGDLVLRSPAHFGNGDGSDETDLPLLTDNYDPKRPVITGTSLAGALRAYLRRYLAGDADRDTLDEALFGGAKGDEDGEQSLLIVDDALGTADAGVELRDGVKLEATSRTASDQALFNIETWTAGTVFPVRVELLLIEGKDNAAALRALAAALTGLTNGGITLGMRKQRGYGQVSVARWRVRRYRLAERSEDLLAWLREGNKPLSDQNSAVAAAVDAQGEPLPDDQMMRNLLQALGSQAQPLAHRDHVFELQAEFALQSSLMIRGNTGRDDLGPDMVHLHSRRNGKSAPVLPGTSLAGALRARALRILNTLRPDRASAIVDALFGPSEVKSGMQASASRLITTECEIRDAIDDLVQNRIRIDRFTGGVMEGALFEEQPVFAKPETRLTLRMHIRSPKEHEIGLLLLLLKDLWSGDLPLGGEIGIGRGRLQGRSARLIWRRGAEEHTWTITQDGDALRIEGDKDVLERFVSENLCRELRGEEVTHVG